MEQINVIIEFLNKLSVSEIISYTIAFISLFFTCVAYMRSRRTQKPKFFISSASIRNEEFKDTTIDIKQGDRSLSSLTISRFALWNTGITLNRSDIAEKDPIRIEARNDVEILEIQFLYSEPQNGCGCIIADDKKSISINFDFLAKNQGIVLKIFHTGKDSTDLSVKGSLKNGLSVSKSYNLMNDLIPMRYIRRYITFSMIKKMYGILFLLTGSITILLTIIRYSKGTSTRVYGLTETIFGVVFGILVAFSGYYIYRRIMPSRLEKAFLSER